MKIQIYEVPEWCGGGVSLRVTDDRDVVIDDLHEHYRAGHELKAYDKAIRVLLEYRRKRADDSIARVDS